VIKMTDLDKSAVPNYLDELRLDKKVFVVIGAGQGIGRQSAHALSQAGATVICVGRGQAMIDSVAHEIGGVAVCADATVRGDVEALFDRVLTDRGRVDGVVDILGQPIIKPLSSVSDEDWQNQFDLVLRHAFLATQIGSKAIAASGQGGSLTLVGSMAGLDAVKNHTLYGTAKAALHHFARSAAAELGPQGIRVNVVAPAFTRTPKLEGRLTELQWRKIESYYPLGAAATTSDIARVVLFLASGLSSHVSGQILAADGGLTAKAALYDYELAQI
jgi:NAD(P)-dependent dehydrogenase (short-subunit alcohol dehydrogenase family)